MTSCEHNLTAPGYVYYINGSQHIHLKCVVCDHILPGAKAKADYQNVDLPTWRDDTDLTVYPPCAYTGCNNPGLENHHWALQSLFYDADNWPQSPLCQPHHVKWHQTLLTHGLTYPGNEAP